MSQLIQVIYTQTLDRRLAKFTSSRHAKSFRCTNSVQKQIRLNPLDHTPNVSSNHHSLRSSINTLNPINRDSPASQASHSTTQLDEETENSQKISPVKDRKRIKRNWQLVLLKVLQALSTDRSGDKHWTRFICWKKRLQRGVRILAQRRKLKILAATIVVKCWKQYKGRARFLALKGAATVISKHWRRHAAQVTYRKTKKALLLIQLYAKLRYSMRSCSAVLIQRHFRGYLARREHRPTIVQTLRLKKHQEMLRQHSLRAQERKQRVAAVRTIEDRYSKALNRRRLRALRPYLWTLPYECRVLYLKFKQVKRDADILKADVEQMIAKKHQEQLLGNE